MAADDTLVALEADLRSLGRTIRVPDADLSAPVLLALANDGAPGGRPSRLADLAGWLRARWRAVVAVLLGATIAVGAVSPVGAAVGRWFGIGGVVISQQPAGEEPAGDGSAGPSMSSTPEGSLTGSSSVPTSAIATGPQRVSLQRAGALVGFTPRLPAGLGAPDVVEVSADRRVLSLEWTSTTGGPLRLDEFGGSPAPYFYKQYYGEITATTVGSDDALWLPRPHALIYVDAQGREHTESARTSAQTLVWLHRDVTLRLEGALTLERALQIARSVPR